MSSRVTSENPFSETSRNAAFKSASRRSASETWAARGMVRNTNRPVSQVQAEGRLSHESFRRIDFAAMRVQVLYFAAFREAVGKDAETRELPDRATVAELWKAL